ncbi:MAG: type II toxin-antitoxin system RelE/ParE family toxin [Acutalibacter sp.]
MNKLHISDDARQDLAEIKQYIAEDLDSPSAAAQTVKAILKGIARLKEQSRIGAPLSSIVPVESEYRFLVYGKYLTFYRVVAQDVYIDRILYGRRNYLAVLFGELTDTEPST